MERRIWLTSDTHFCHNKEFIWKARGYNNVKEMNENIIEKWNSLVKKDDIVYHLGDVVLEDLETGIKYLKRLNGHIFIAIGNHDTEKKIKEYLNCPNVDDVQFGYRIKKGKKTCILTHYPTIIANKDNIRVPAFYGHTHQTTNFFQNYRDMYHVGLDSHSCYPVLLDQALKELYDKFY